MSRNVNLTEIADVERVKKGKIYPTGTVYIQVSACNHNDSEKFHILKADGELETKYAVILPKVECYPEYLQNVLEFFAGDFFTKYVGTNINVQIDSFKYFKLKWHDSLAERGNYCQRLKEMDTLIEAEERVIENLKQFKGYMLHNCFPC